MAVILQTIFSNAFSWMKMFKFPLRFHWSLLVRVQFAIFQHWFRLGDRQLSEAMKVDLLTHICVTRPQWVNTCPLQWIGQRQLQDKTTIPFWIWGFGATYIKDFALFFFQTGLVPYTYGISITREIHIAISFLCQLEGMCLIGLIETG